MLVFFNMLIELVMLNRNDVFVDTQCVELVRVSEKWEWLKEHQGYSDSLKCRPTKMQMYKRIFSLKYPTGICVLCVTVQCKMVVQQMVLFCLQFRHDIRAEVQPRNDTLL